MSVSRENRLAKAMSQLQQIRDAGHSNPDVLKLLGIIRTITGIHHMQILELEAQIIKGTDHRSLALRLLKEAIRELEKI